MFLICTRDTLTGRVGRKDPELHMQAYKSGERLAVACETRGSATS